MRLNISRAPLLGTREMVRRIARLIEKAEKRGA
jgi:hypothetical protein